MPAEEHKASLKMGREFFKKFPNAFPFSYLPRSLQLRVFTFLHPGEKGFVTRVSKNWYSLIRYPFTYSIIFFLNQSNFLILKFPFIPRSPSLWSVIDLSTFPPFSPEPCDDEDYDESVVLYAKYQHRARSFINFLITVRPKVPSNLSTHPYLPSIHSSISFIHPLIHTFQSIHSSIPSIHPLIHTIHPSTHSSYNPSTHPYLPIHPLIHTIHPSTHPYLPSIHSSIPSIHPLIHTFQFIHSSIPSNSSTHSYHLSIHSSIPSNSSTHSYHLSIHSSIPSNSSTHSYHLSIHSSIPSNPSTHPYLPIHPLIHTIHPLTHSCFLSTHPYLPSIHSSILLHSVPSKPSIFTLIFKTLSQYNSFINENHQGEGIQVCL